MISVVECQLMLQEETTEQYRVNEPMRRIIGFVLEGAWSVYSYGASVVSSRFVGYAINLVCRMAYV